MKSEEEIRSRLGDLKQEFQASGHALTQPQSPLDDKNIRQKRVKLYERVTELQWVLGDEIQGWDSK